MHTGLVNLTNPIGSHIMKSIKFVVAASVLASISFVSDSDQASKVEQSLKQDIAGVCPTWPICRDVNYIEDNTTMIFQGAEIKKLNKSLS